MGEGWGALGLSVLAKKTVAYPLLKPWHAVGAGQSVNVQN